MAKIPFIEDEMTVQPATDRKLRIAQVAPLWTKVPPSTYGGIELLVSLLTDELVKRGHDVTLFASGDSRTDGNLHSVVDVNILEAMTQGKSANYEYYANSAVAQALSASDRFDVIHFHIGCEYIPFGTLSEGSVLFTMHTQPGPDDVWVMGRHPAVSIVAISRFQLGSLESSLRTDIPVVYNGCDFESFEPVFEPGKYLVFLGRLSYDKNPLDAIRIAKKLDMPIILAGNFQGKKEASYFETQIKPLINNEDVKHVGLVNHAQKNELLKNAAALLFPVQWNEPFGMVMIEAMACGTPVVAHNLGSIAEVVDDGVTGFRADSIEAMSDLVQPAIALDRKTVRSHAMSRFGYRRMVDDYEKIYLSLQRKSR